MVSIGIDVGTTTICACVVDIESGEVLRTWTYKHGFLSTANPMEKIQSVEEIEKTISRILEEITPFADITYLGLTGQMHGILIWIPQELPSLH